MGEYAELLWQLIEPWVPDAAVAAVTLTRYEAYHPQVVARHRGAARERVLRALIRSDCELALARWPLRPLSAQKLLRSGRVYGRESDWLLDYARASAAYKCVAVLRKAGGESSKGSKTRGGRQSKWRSWI
jgi:hypothetical protein